VIAELAAPRLTLADLAGVLTAAPRSQPYCHEGPARAWVRALLCLEGRPWRAADRTAAELVLQARALARVETPPGWDLRRNPVNHERNREYARLWRQTRKPGQPWLAAYSQPWLAAYSERVRCRKPRPKVKPPPRVPLVGLCERPHYLAKLTFTERLEGGCPNVAGAANRQDGLGHRFVARCLED
jgi:hypothetical protein